MTRAAARAPSIRPPSPPLGLLLPLVLLACSRSDAAGDAAKGRAPEVAPLVRTAVVARRQVQRKIETTANIESQHQVLVRSRVAGRVKSVPVDEAQAVEKGAVLALLDSREIETTLSQVEVQIADRKLRLELAKLEHESSQFREAQARFELDKTKKDLARLEDLDAELVSRKEIDDLRYAKDRATAAMKIAEFSTRKAGLDVDTAAQAIRELEARKAEVQIQIAEHRILAPISGVVTHRMVKGGEAISTATDLFEVVDTQNLIAYLDRPQRELGLVEQAKVVRFTSEAYPGREFLADVDAILPVVDRATGSFRIRVRVRTADVATLRPGLFMRAQILTEENREAIMIPKTAVLADGDDSIVFYVRNPLNGRGKARRLKLEAGIEDDDSVECRNRGTHSLKPGDLVIVSGQQDLKDQTEVELSKDG